MFVKTLCGWIISSGNLKNLDLCLRETCCIFNSSSWNLLLIDFSLRETFTLIFSPRKTGFGHEACCMIFCSSNLIYLHIFFLKTNYVLIFSFGKLNLPWNFSFVKLVACSFFLRETWCMLILFMKLAVLSISSRNFMYLYLCLRETCYIFIYSSWHLLHDGCSIFERAHWCFSSWNRFCLWGLLCSDYCSWNSTYLDIFLRETLENLIYHDCFLRETCCMLVFVWFLVIFVRITLHMWIRSSRNSMYLHLCLQKTCYIYISSSWNLLNVDFSLRETFTSIFSARETSFGHKTCCNLIFCSWNLIYLHIFFLKTYCVFIYSFVKHNLPWNFSFVKLVECSFFLRGTWCMLILFMKLATYWYFSSRDFMYLDLCLWETCYVFFYSSWHLMHDGCSILETCTLMFLLVKQFLFMGFVAFWLLFMKLNLSGYFSSWNLCYDDLVLWKTLIYHDIFLCETCWMLVFWGFLVIFVRIALWMWITSSRDSMYLHLCLQKTCYIYISCSWNLLNVDFSLREILIMDFSRRETGFDRWHCSVLIFVRET